MQVYVVHEKRASCVLWHALLHDEGAVDRRVLDGEMVIAVEQQGRVHAELHDADLRAEAVRERGRVGPVWRAARFRGMRHVLAGCQAHRLGVHVV